MPSTHFNQPETYEIRIKATGEVVEKCRTWQTAKILLPKLKKEYFQDMEIVKVKKNYPYEKVMSSYH